MTHQDITGSNIDKAENLMANPATSNTAKSERVSLELLDRLDRIEAALKRLIDRGPAKQWFTPAEMAEEVGKAEFTVREWCRLGRIRAEKRACGRGDNREWMISVEEVQRYMNHGLLPDPHRYRHVR
jgi:hypothetical protein